MVSKHGMEGIKSFEPELLPQPVFCLLDTIGSDVEDAGNLLSREVGLEVGVKAKVVRSILVFSRNDMYHQS